MGIKEIFRPLPKQIFEVGEEVEVLLGKKKPYVWVRAIVRNPELYDNSLLESILCLQPWIQVRVHKDSPLFGGQIRHFGHLRIRKVV